MVAKGPRYDLIHLSMRIVVLLSISLLCLAGCGSRSRQEGGAAVLEVTFLTRAGCPGSPRMLENLRAALAETSTAYELHVLDLGDLAASDHRTGYGTPSVLVGGLDLFGRSRPEPATPM